MRRHLQSRLPLTTGRLVTLAVPLLTGLNRVAYSTSCCVIVDVSRLATVTKAARCPRTLTKMLSEEAVVRLKKITHPPLREKKSLRLPNVDRDALSMISRSASLRGWSQNHSHCSWPSPSTIGTRRAPLATDVSSASKALSVIPSGHCGISFPSYRDRTTTMTMFKSRSARPFERYEETAHATHTDDADQREDAAYNLSEPARPFLPPN